MRLNLRPAPKTLWMGGHAHSRSTYSNTLKDFRMGRASFLIAILLSIRRCRLQHSRSCQTTARRSDRSGYFYDDGPDCGLIATFRSVTSGRW